MIPPVVATTLDADGWEQVRAEYGIQAWQHPTGATCRIGRTGRVTVWTHPARDATFAPGAPGAAVAAYLSAVVR